MIDLRFTNDDLQSTSDGNDFKNRKSSFVNRKSLNLITIQKMLILRRMPTAQRLVFHEFLDFHDAVDDLLGSRRAARHINIDRNDFIDALQNRIRVKNAARRRASSDRQNPFWLSHLDINLLQNRPHFFRNRAHDHQKIGLPRRKTEPFHAKTSQIVVRPHRRHELDAAARSRKRQRPNRVGSSQTDRCRHFGGEKALAFESGGRCVNFYHCSLFFERGTRGLRRGFWRIEKNPRQIRVLALRVPRSFLSNHLSHSRAPFFKT